jgi:hypothetical protein
MRRSKFEIKGLPLEDNGDGPAALMPFTGDDGKEYKPLSLAFQNFAKQERPPGPVDLRFTLTDCLPRSFDPKKVGPISIEDAIYGIPGYLKSIDMTTSVGYYFKKMGFKSRRDLCYKDGQPFIHPVLRRAVEQIIEKAKNGIITPVVFEETLKDEIRSEEKIKAGQTRLFSAGDLASFIAQRMYLGTFFVEMTKDPSGCPFGLAINPHSGQWGELYSYLKGQASERRRVGAGDFRYYDISGKNIFLERFIDFVTTYYSPGDRKAAECLIRANFVGYHVCGTVLFLRPWGTCSGSFITSMFNSFMNWCMHKEAFISLFSEEEWKVIRTTFTGDDSVFTTPEEYSAYNMTYLSVFFKKNYGMEYTSPTKTKEMEVTWESLQYLKRTFVPGHFGIMAPLAKRSLMNMIKWTDVDQTPDVMDSVINSLLQEAWHYGEDFYTECREWAVKESRRLSMTFGLPKFGDMSHMRNDDYGY